MILSFSDVCIVKLTNCPKSVQLYLENEGLIHHQIEKNSLSIGIEVQFESFSKTDILQNLHPNACVTERGFAFHDEREKLIYPNYNFEDQALILSDRGISASFFWDILFDHIKLFLLKRDIITLHAAGVKSENKAILFFGWDGTGKSSLLIDSMSNGYEYQGDDRLFLSADGTVGPLFQSIKQFHHELINYPQLMNKVGFKKRFFIRWSQRLEKRKSKLNSLLLKIFRKLNLNYVIIPADYFGKLNNQSAQLEASFYFNKTELDVKVQLEHTIVQRLAANVVYADSEMLRRYHTALFSGHIDTIDCFNELYSYVYRILDQTINPDQVKLVNINQATEINFRLWDSQQPISH